MKKTNSVHLVNPTAAFHSLLLLLLKRGINFWNFCEFISIAGAFRAIFPFRNFRPCTSILRGEILLKNFCNFQFFYWFCRLRTKKPLISFFLFFIKEFFEPKQNLTCFMYNLCPFPPENGKMGLDPTNGQTYFSFIWANKKELVQFQMTKTIKQLSFSQFLT